MYIHVYGAPFKARNFNVVYIWTYVWQCWKPSLSIYCTMFQHWINAESFPVSQLCVNTLLATKVTITNWISFGKLSVENGPIPVDVGNAGSSHAGGMDVCRECYVLSGRGLCVELINRPEECYRLWCVWERSWSYDREGTLSKKGFSYHEQN
jgi:hypothetical protein